MCLHPLGAFAPPGRSYTYYRCSVTSGTRPDKVCNCWDLIRESEVRSHFDKLLREFLTTGDLSALDQTPEETGFNVTALESDIAEVKRQLEVLIIQQVSMTSLAAQTAYTSQIDALGQRQEILEANLRRAQHRNDAEIIRQRARAFEELRSIGIDNLWELPPTRINQLLHAFMGQWRLRASKGQIVGRIWHTGRNMRYS